MCFKVLNFYIVFRRGAVIRVVSVFMCVYMWLLCVFFIDGGVSTHDFHEWVRERESMRAGAIESAGEAERTRGQ